MQSLPSWVLGGVGQGKTQVLTIQPVFLVTKMLPSDIKICPAVFSSCSFNYYIFFSKDIELVKVQYPGGPSSIFPNIFHVLSVSAGSRQHICCLNQSLWAFAMCWVGDSDMVLVTMQRIMWPAGEPLHLWFLAMSWVNPTSIVNTFY